MPKLVDFYSPAAELALGTRMNDRVPEPDQTRQRAEVEEILQRLRSQPGVILADEVGMGKTYVALAAAVSVSLRNPRGPVIVMVPANLVGKWEQDLQTFTDLYLTGIRAVFRISAPRSELLAKDALRYGVARHSIDLMKLLDDAPRERCHVIFLAQGAMSRRQSDKWVRLALIAETLRRHGRRERLAQVKRQIHRFLAELLRAIGEEKAHGWGEELWQELMQSSPEYWREIYNASLRRDQKELTDDPVPKSVIRALDDIELRPLAEALEEMPVRASVDGGRLSERIGHARNALRSVEQELWKDLLVRARWRSPLLVMDEAHHLKNPGASLARQLQSPDLDGDLRTGDGAMAKAFDRMLFLTATPFQLGHSELVRVLERFGDARWDANELGDPAMFKERMKRLDHALNESQRTAIALQRAWSRLRPEDCDGDVDAWWSALLTKPREALSNRQRAVVEAYDAAKRQRDTAETNLRPWIMRHNKTAHWPGTETPRRERLEGAAIAAGSGAKGLPVPPQQLLPFFLAARSAVKPGQDLLGEALCSSYEAFRNTRSDRKAVKDEQDEPWELAPDFSHARWYLDEFDRALQQSSGSDHPKVDVTVKKVVDLWERGEKVLVFAFYRHTCRALRLHISHEVERRIFVGAQNRLQLAGMVASPDDIDRLLKRIQDRFFDTIDSPGRKALDTALGGILAERATTLQKAGIGEAQQRELADVMRRFLRVATTLTRYFPLAELDEIGPEQAVARTLDHADSSSVSWRSKFEGFLEFLAERCSPSERDLYIEAALRTQTRGIRVSAEDGDVVEADGTGAVTLANIQMATGETNREQRSRLMRAFNTPFFPDILVCSEVMGEGVDLQRFCRHVIHHDLAWNPSTIEQRTGRIDRLGCKAEGKHPIMVFLPYLDGAADERQFKVMSDREQWFRVVMGQDEVAKLITTETENAVPLPAMISEELGFKLGLGSTDKG